MKTLIQKLMVAVLLMGCTHAWGQCAAGFSVVPGSAGSYTFLNTSTGTSTATIYSYSFGNNMGWVSSTNPNASYSYSSNGVYTVALSIADSSNGCFATAVQTILVNSAGCNASLVISNLNGPSGAVNFSHNLIGSSNTTSWTFGDGNSGSGAPVSHNYSVSGVYNVNATVSIFGGLCTYTASKTITVNVAPCGLSASFGYTVGSLGNVSFQSTSTGASSMTTYYWSFGDGGTGSGPNINHSYSFNGTYPVTLGLTDSIGGFFCSDVTTVNIVVSNVPCPNLTSFWMSKDSSQTLTWNAYPQYPSNISGATWNWGDGSSSTALYPSHTYSAAAVYTICLSATVSCGTSTITCVGSSIYKPAAGGEGSGDMITLNVVDVSKATGINHVQQKAKIKVYPNPSNGLLFISGLASGENTVKVFDLMGKIILHQTIKSGTAVDVSTLENGIYILQLSGSSGQHTERLVIEK